MRQPISVTTGTKRTVRGNREVAKCVARRSAAHVAWSIGASFLVKEQRLIHPVTSHERRLLFQVRSGATRPTQARSCPKNARNRLNSVALARLAKNVATGPRPGGSGGWSSTRARATPRPCRAGKQRSESRSLPPGSVGPTTSRVEPAEVSRDTANPAPTRKRPCLAVR